MFNFIKKLFNPPKLGYNGGLVSPKDDRDYIKQFERGDKGQIVGAVGNVPLSFSLDHMMGKILNQGATNSCSGHAGTYFMNILVSKTLNAFGDYKLNPFYNYYYARKESGLLGQDGGAYIRSALKALTKYGVWNCNMSNPSQKPPTDFDINNSFKLKGYEALTRGESLIEDMKYVLSVEQLPLMLCVNIIDKNINSWSGEMKSNGNITGSSGWHAMCAVGYKTKTDGTWFKVANSWSSSWGDNGFAWIHENYFNNTSLVSEIWCPVKSYY